MPCRLLGLAATLVAVFSVPLASTRAHVPDWTLGQHARRLASVGAARESEDGELIGTPSRRKALADIYNRFTMSSGATSNVSRCRPASARRREDGEGMKGFFFRWQRCVAATRSRSMRTARS